jgi:hypothetical protein
LCPTLWAHYNGLTEIYFERKHYFWALELCERGLEADKDNRGLQKLHGQIKQRIGQIPEKSRVALKDLAELPMGRIEKAGDFLEILPKVSQLVQPLSQDFPASREVVEDLVELINAVLGLETVPLIDRNKEISRLREMTAKIEGELPLYLPKASISALLPVLKGVRKTLGEIQAKSICPEFTFTLEPASYYRENEASLVYKLRNTGPADIHKLRIVMESKPPYTWVPVLEEHSLDVVKKDGVFWVDWPVHLEKLPEPEAEIKPKITLRFTGGNLRGESVEQTMSDQVTKLVPFIDINVDYPVIALKPEEGNKLYGRENLLRTLKNSFTRSGQTRIPFLEGVRKVGKTSILYFLASRIGDNLLPVYVNLDTTWTNPFQLLAKRVSDEVAVRIDVESGDWDWIVTRDDFDRFLASIMRRTNIRRCVLLLDEFHTVIDRIEAGSLSSEFLGDLRYMYMSPEQKVSVTFADWHLIDELKARVPAQLWTDFAREPVSFLNELDTREAILAPAMGSPLRFERDVISSIYYYTNGYPWHIQWICSELVNHLNIQKRYVVIPQDIDLIARRLLKEDRLFNEGVCRPERLSRDSQCVIYSMLEALEESKQDIRTGFSRDVVMNLRLSVDVKHELSRLIQLEVLQEREDQVRFCSPLHAMWFETKRQKGSDIRGGLSTEKEESVSPLSPVGLPDDPASEIRRKVEHLRELKNQLRLALRGQSQVFKNVEMPNEWANASIVVPTQEAWGTFIKALRDLFVEDMLSRLDVWEDRRRYPTLNRELHSIRQRRNYVEHPDSKEGKEEEEKSCLRDIGKRFPTSTREWTLLQLKTLDHFLKALQETFEQIAKA